MLCVLYVCDVSVLSVCGVCVLCVSVLCVCAVSVLFMCCVCAVCVLGVQSCSGIPGHIFSSRGYFFDNPRRYDSDDDLAWSIIPHNSQARYVLRTAAEDTQTEPLK